MRLIDADQLKAIIEGGFDIDFSETPELKKELLNMVDYQETIEAEPVIRCKDCINFTSGQDEWGNCFENPMKMWRETDFCSWAERRDDGTE